MSTISRDLRGSWLLAASLALAACAEKPSVQQTPAAGGSAVKTSGDTGDDPTSDSGNTQDSGITPDQQQQMQTYDLCRDGLKKSAKLADFADLVKILCDQKKIDAMRQPDNIFTGGDNKIFEDDLVKGDTRTSFKLSTSGLYDADGKAYWALTRLQFVKPTVFKDNYATDPDATMSEDVPTSTGATYRYKNSSGEGGQVDYRAQTTFITLLDGVSWVAATKKVGDTIETMDALKALIIVNRNPKNNAKTEVFTISDQTYVHASGQAQTYHDRAMSSLRLDQKNGFTNAKSASKAPGLLGP